MTRIGSLSVVAGALAVVAIGGAGPAQADDPDWGFGGPQVNYGYDFYYPRNGNPWMDQMVPSVKVPRVDTSVRN
ncbi:hypothetical protein [Mycobacterium sp. 236(2023)]|uniref:hypothetical protein n=1 Tax=Mycobacterium sp. 236(2023) TaxID=3038163 RepID=UPI002414E44D|nr:hypothetical protein [Mycobacterium sp. 236(2023)]MDG4667168.1 hypothetical protein [Mycobacterium sp. 236(2023)]